MTSRVFQKCNNKNITLLCTILIDDVIPYPLEYDNSPSLVSSGKKLSIMVELHCRDDVSYEGGRGKCKCRCDVCVCESTCVSVCV